MKTSFSRHGVAGLLLSSLFALSAYAGSGAQIWQKSTPVTDASVHAIMPASVCPGSQLVPVTAMAPSWINGRGPLAPVQIGEKRVCSVCLVTSVATAGWSNGRGPETKTETSTSGVLHTCNGHCGAKS